MADDFVTLVVVTSDGKQTIFNDAAFDVVESGALVIYKQMPDPKYDGEIKSVAAYACNHWKTVMS